VRWWWWRPHLSWPSSRRIYWETLSWAEIWETQDLAQVLQAHQHQQTCLGSSVHSRKQNLGCLQECRHSLERWYRKLVHRKCSTDRHIRSHTGRLHRRILEPEGPVRRSEGEHHAHQVWCSWKSKTERRDSWANSQKYATYVDLHLKLVPGTTGSYKARREMLMISKDRTCWLSADSRLCTASTAPNSGHYQYRLLQRIAEEEFQETATWDILRCPPRLRFQICSGRWRKLGFAFSLPSKRHENNSFAKPRQTAFESFCC